jgi:type II secretory pathway component PulM
MTGITPKYELKIIIDPPMAGKVDGAGKYAEGKEVQVDVTTFAGWEFLGWSGDISHSKQNFSFKIEKDMTATATFKKVAKPIDRLTILSGVILLLSITTTVCLYIIIDKIRLNEEKTGSTIISQSESLNQKIESLAIEQTKLRKQIESLTSSQTVINQKLDDSVYDHKATTERLSSLAKTNVDYKVWTGALTSTTTTENTNEIYPMYISSSKSVHAYLSGMTDDADFAVLDPQGKQISSSTRSTPVPDAIDFRTSLAGQYTFKIWRAPTKYKLEIYVRN